MFALKVSAVLALASSALAGPISGYGPGHGCLTNASATRLVNNFIQLTNGDDFDEDLARALIVPDVVDTSGSVASIINGGKSWINFPLNDRLCQKHEQFR